MTLTILRQLGAEGCFYRGDAKRRLHREIEVLQSIQHVKPVVIVDEAHLLDRETMEELRFLLNFKIDSDSPMALILVGQPELSDKLRRQAYLAIEQRVNLKCYNPYLDEAQTKALSDRFNASLEASLRDWQVRHRALILVAPAVVQGAPDITREIQTDVARRMKEGG